MIEGWSSPEPSQALIDPGGAMNPALHDLSFLCGRLFGEKKKKDCINQGRDLRSEIL